MSGRKLILRCSEVAVVIDELHAKEPDGWRKNRLLAVKLAAKGKFTSAEIAEWPEAIFSSGSRRRVRAELMAC